MKTIAQDQKRTESLLQRRGIRLHDIQSFSFMKRFHEVPRKSNLKVKDKYGAGILTLRLKQGIQRAFYVHPFQKPSSVIRPRPISAHHSICSTSLCFSSRL